MSKYRGKQNGKTRGPYIRKTLVYNPQNEQELVDLSEQITHYLSNSGIYITGLDTSNQAFSKDCYLYHMAGASIGLSSTNYKDIHDYSLVMNLVSNNGLDDVVKKITQKFPILTEYTPSKMYRSI